ncbi:MAG: polyphosphate kinase 2 family protein [Propionibacteriales bacterium]|nr:polyphosphate kinase 2 family protein [Propionibacteriales bacterium]
MAKTLSDLLRVPDGPVDLSAYDSHGKPGFDGDKADGKAALTELGDHASDLQERLYAEAKGGGLRRILVLLQGMDTSGKGGVIRHSVGLLDPQGIQLASFKAPTDSERQHAFLWRIKQRLPVAGMVGIFDRSQYEDVLIAKVRELVDTDEIERRYAAINSFEKRLADAGTAIIKCMLHISKDEQRERLLARLDDPTKHWKFNPGDIDERALWDDYQHAYELALERCTTEAAPWYVVPSDRKWYRNWAVTTLLVEHLERLDPQWPEAEFDVEEQKARLADSCRAEGSSLPR